MVEGHTVEHHRDHIVLFPIPAVVKAVCEALLFDVRRAIVFYPYALAKIHAIVVAITLAYLIVGFVFH